MATLEERKAELSELDIQMETILLTAKEKNDGQLSEEQRVEYDTLDASYDEKHKTYTEDLERDKKRDKRKTELATTVTASGPSFQQEPIGSESTTGTRITVKEKEFLCLGDQLQAIANVAMSGQENTMLSWEQLAVATGGAQAGVPSDGGYLIQKDFVTDLTNAMSSVSTLPPVRTIPIGPNSDGLKLNVINETSRATGSRWGSVQVYWGAEGDAATAEKPTFRQMELELKELIGLAYATNRLLADASALEAVFLQAFSEEMTFMKEDARINGTGSGQPRGITSTTGASATVSVAKETGQEKETVLYENIVNMWSRLWARSRANAVWLINQDVEPSLMKMGISVGTGGHPAYLPPGGLSVAPYGTLMGREVRVVEYCATLGTVNDIILWDPTQYIEIEKGGMQADQSIHVRFTTNENTFRFITRVDGQPLWNSPLTPFKGTSTTTLSPQIVLATRA